jgi:mitochondrial fission protein ELM1
MKCWGITDGSAGMEAQVKALGHALGLVPQMKRITVAAPWAWLPNACYASPLKTLLVPYFLAEGKEELAAPYPDLVISCGRKGAMVAMGLRSRIKEGGTKFIHIQDPQVDSRQFDIVVAMEHDHIHGPNVLKTRFALHTITPPLLDKLKSQYAPRFASYPDPKTVVLIGGSTNKYTLTGGAMMRLITTLQSVASHVPGSLLITPSRRTSNDHIDMLKATFAGNERVYIYEGGGENPYLGLLALAQTLIVTNDSVNMMSEAAATGRPLYLLMLEGHVDTKPARFAEALIRDGIARPLTGRLVSWGYHNIGDEMKNLARDVRQRLNLP